MRIAHKLILGFLGTSLAVGGIGIVSVYQGLEARSNSQSLVQNPISQATNGWDITVALQKSAVLAQKLVLVRYKDKLEHQSPSEQNLGRIEADIRQALKTINNRLELAKVYAQAADLANQKAGAKLENSQLALIETLQSDVDVYEKLFLEYLALSATDLTQAQHFLDQTLEPYFRRTLTPLAERYQQGLENQLFSQTLADNVVIGTTYQYIATVVLSAVVVAMLLGMLIAYSIHRQITRLKNAAEEVGTGKLDVRIDLQSNDEFGVLAATFNQMLVDLGQVTVSKSYLDKILDSMIESLMVLSPEATIQRVNEATLKLLGYQEVDLIGKSVYSVLSADFKLDFGSNSPALSDGFAEQGETTYLSESGIQIPVSCSATMIEDGFKNTQGIVLVARDITDLKRAQSALKHSATHDSLTGLPNRSLFQERLEHAIALARRDDYIYAVLFLDLDRFKAVNDTLGHLAGDQLLIEITDRVKTCVREGDTVARLGGDEFAILLEPIKTLDDAIDIADRIQTILSQPFTLVGQDVLASTSIGIASSARGYSSLEEILRDADTAMYESKQRGRARYTVFDHDHSAALKHKTYKH